MDSLINAAAHALSAGDPLGALKLVALRNDAPALALRGIAMAQLGDLVRAKALLRRAARAFGPKEALAARGASWPRPRSPWCRATWAFPRKRSIQRERRSNGTATSERRACTTSRNPAPSARRAPRRGRACAHRIRCNALATGIAGRL